ncbi:hypothetical protein DRQ36_02770 [bacterium]|nr:MAG: hypothetical protein DRQ36_02770 [bacterium]
MPIKVWEYIISGRKNSQPRQNPTLAPADSIGTNLLDRLRRIRSSQLKTLIGIRTRTEVRGYLHCHSRTDSFSKIFANRKYLTYQIL